MHDLLQISKVNLVYLGENRFARLWKKDDPNGSSYLGPNFNFQFTPQAVTPAKPAKPAKPHKPARSAPPTQVELRTEETLLELSGNVVHLLDAMDKIVGHQDTCSPPKKADS